MNQSITVDIQWSANFPLQQGRSYIISTNGFSSSAQVLRIKNSVSQPDCPRLTRSELNLGEQASVDLSLAEPLPEELTNNTTTIFHLKKDDVHGGTFTLEHILRRSTNVVWQKTDIDKGFRAEQKNQLPKTIWFTGLSGSGKSTLANALEMRLCDLGFHTMLLDGDNVRHGLNKNLGFNEIDRVENVRRISEVAKLMNDAGLIVLTAFISPYEEDRKKAKEIIGESYFEVHVSTPIEECERRDIKGLYAKARKGLIPNFTGITAPFEIPECPSARINTELMAIEDAIEQLLTRLELRTV